MTASNDQVFEDLVDNFAKIEQDENKNVEVKESKIEESTRSRIGIVNPDGSIESIYSHYDGYPDGVGKTLKQHYTDEKKVKELISLGDISSLGEEIGSKHDFDNPPKGETNAYGRDKGEKDVRSKTVKDERSYLDLASRTGANYVYLFKDGKWEEIKKESTLDYKVESKTKDTDEGKNPKQGDKEKKGKFYPHDVEAARRASRERMQKARAQDKIPVLAEYAILHLIDIAERGLPDCYESFEDFLYDFYPDFTWDERSKEEIQAVLDDPRFKEIVPVLKKDWGVNMEEELKQALKEGKNPKQGDKEKTQIKKLSEQEEVFEIMFYDLDEETQKELLKFVEADSAEDMNWDTIPIATVPKPEEDLDL